MARRFREGQRVVLPGGPNTVHQIGGVIWNGEAFVTACDPQNTMWEISTGN